MYIWDVIRTWIKNILRGTCDMLENEEDTDGIKHVIVISLEGRSYDQIFGYRYINNQKVGETDRYFNMDDDNIRVYQNPINTNRFITDEKYLVKNDLFSTLRSIHGVNYDNKMGGFLKGKKSKNGNALVIKNDIMGYFTKNTFPVYEYIIDNFTVCDRWFSSIPTGSLPNKMFGLCGSSDGHISDTKKLGNNKLLYKCDTIFDRLNEKGIEWNVYMNDFPVTLVLEHQLRNENIERYKPFTKLKKDIKRGDLASFVYIEPEYIYKGKDQMNGERIVYEVINLLQKKRKVWNSSLLIVYYDYNGGYYDHVFPPKAVSVTSIDSNYMFNQYGCRVPAMLISPRIPLITNHKLYDHTSVLRYMCKKWGLRGLTPRDISANEFSDMILPYVRNVSKIKGIKKSNMSLVDYIVRKDITLYKEIFNSHIHERLEDIKYVNKDLHDLFVEFMNLKTTVNVN